MRRFTSLRWLSSSLLILGFLARRIYSSLLILGFLFMMASTAEWLTWVNTDRYPHWLAHEYVAEGSTQTSEDIFRLMPAFEKLCNKPGGFAVITKANGTFLRCDNSISVFGWFDGVYLIH